VQSQNAVIRFPRRRVPESTPWDARVAAWEELAKSPVFTRLAREVLELASPGRDDVAVDLGAGTGLLSLGAARTAAAVYAVDYSEPMLERLLERARADGLENVYAVVADMREVPLDDESADVVVSSYAFHHLRDDGKELALAEARRLLRPGGRLVVCDMMFSLSLRPRDRRIVAGKTLALARKGPAGLMRLARNAGRLASGRWEHPVSPERWRDLLEARHFVEIDVVPAEAEAGLAFARRPEVPAQ
jgi:SAM-dependent methyltransferase